MKVERFMLRMGGEPERDLTGKSPYPPSLATSWACHECYPYSEHGRCRIPGTARHWGLCSMDGRPLDL